jgi:hypothetical protein
MYLAQPRFLVPTPERNEGFRLSPGSVRSVGRSGSPGLSSVNYFVLVGPERNGGGAFVAFVGGDVDVHSLAIWRFKVSFWRFVCSCLVVVMTFCFVVGTIG